MYSFLICLAVLIASYFIYGKILEKVADIDENRQTPVHRFEDGVDYMPMSRIKAFLVQFLNIAGTGPIFGVIQGALFGPAAFLWITLGTIFIGAVHDFFSGFLSLRDDGSTMPHIISKYLGTTAQKFIAVVTVITGIFVGAVFSTGSAALLSNLTSIPLYIWTAAIFGYFIIATLLPVDKIIGKVYPIMGVLFMIMVVLITGAVILNPGYTIPEFTTQGLYLSDNPIFPFLFVTIACGAISGFHASQSPIVARCIKTENDSRPVFFGAMVLEGITALCWAAVALAFFHGQPQLGAIYAAAPAVAVNEMATKLLDPIGVILIIIGIVVCPITTGDTALRSSRITLADELHINQDKLLSRLKLALPIFIVSYALTFIDFNLVWRYVAWAQLIIAVSVLLSATVYLMKKGKLYIITLLPAVFCILITIGYILQAPEGLQLPSMIANAIAIVATAIITVIFVKKYRNI
ncbi:carbon starvation protein A [uncultured Methanobrevibacter sp.]|uniref:carbon starvation CstA family protein n=1 Tax=uncultured Methanobrevibacter sp. TaxID=253161 RepID=UPI00263361AA|nr:carbon starvation CstA family protein [uncultured Methanobrevibacter sp.]